MLNLPQEVTIDNFEWMMPGRLWFLFDIGPMLGSNTIKLSRGFSPFQSAITRPSHVTYHAVVFIMPLSIQYSHKLQVHCSTSIFKILKKTEIFIFSPLFAAYLLFILFKPTMLVSVWIHVLNSELRPRCLAFYKP